MLHCTVASPSHLWNHFVLYQAAASRRAQARCQRSFSWSFQWIEVQVSREQIPWKRLQEVKNNSFVVPKQNTLWHEGRWVFCWRLIRILWKRPYQLINAGMQSDWYLFAGLLYNNITETSRKFNKNIHLDLLQQFFCTHLLKCTKARLNLSHHQFHLEIQDAFICRLWLKLTDTECF